MLFIEKLRVVLVANNSVRRVRGFVTFGSITLVMRAEIQRVRMIRALDIKSNKKKFVSINFVFMLIKVFANRIDNIKRRGGW